MLQCWEYANKYKVLDENKEQIFLLKEESDCLARYCCNNIRPLEGSFQVQCKQTHSMYNNHLPVSLFDVHTLWKHVLIIEMTYSTWRLNASCSENANCHRY